MIQLKKERNRRCVYKYTISIMFFSLSLPLSASLFICQQQQKTEANTQLSRATLSVEERKIQLMRVPATATYEERLKAEQDFILVEHSTYNKNSTLQPF